MRIYSLDGNCLKNPQEAYQYLAERLDFPDYFGRNLDALWDLISERRLEHFIFYHHEAMDDDIKRIFLDSHHRLSFEEELTQDMNLMLREEDPYLEILGDDLTTTVLSFKGLKSVHGLLVEECLLTSDDCTVALLRVLEQHTEMPLILDSKALEYSLMDRGYMALEPLSRIKRTGF